MKKFFKILKSAFCGRDKIETAGIWLGMLTFIPITLCTLYAAGPEHKRIVGLIFGITEALYLTSIAMTIYSLQNENTNLKVTINNLMAMDKKLK